MKILIIVSVWILYGGMIALAIIFDGIYIQVCIDTAIMLLSGFMGYILKGSLQKEAT